MSFLYKRISHKKYDDQIHTNIMQFVHFGLVGASNAVVYYIVYAGTLYILNRNNILPEWGYLLSQTIAFLIGVFWAFSLNRAFVFCKKTSDSVGVYLLELLKFYLAYAFTGLFMNSVLLYLWIHIGVSAYAAPFINILFTTPVNFVLSKKWTFKV